MQNNQKEILELMYQNLLDEKKGFDEKINKNMNRIAEIDAYLQSIYNKENSDFKVFSPRNVENIYKEQIEVSKQEKYAIENENQYQYRQVNKISKYLENLQLILDQQEEIQTEENEIEENKTESNLTEQTEIEQIQKIDILDIQEKERQRIARELHDSSLQNLTHLVHKIELSSMFIDQDPIRAKLELATVNKGIKSVIDEIRNTIFDLRPMTFEDLGFKETVERLLDNFSKETNMNITYEIEEIQNNNTVCLMTLFRVIQESCSNAIKHSEGLNLRVTLKKISNQIQLVVKDDGKGFDVDKIVETKTNHFGLKIMKERIELLGGKLVYDSVLGSGTTISITIPIF